MGDFSTSVVSHMATLCSLLGGDRCRNVREGREAPGVPVEAYWMSLAETWKYDIYVLQQDTQYFMINFIHNIQ